VSESLKSKDVELQQVFNEDAYADDDEDDTAD
jgi:hypothetical protein